MSLSPENETLEETLQRAAKGEEDAWRIIVAAYSGRVFGLIRAQCSNADLAEEITQSVFCTLAEKIGSYTESGRFEPWLFRIAMNRLRDEMRRRKRHARPVEEEKLIGMAGAIENEETPAAGASGEILAMREAICRLSDADQKILHLRHYGGLSFKHIAEIMDQPLGTVLARQHRALKKLRDMLEGDAPSEVREDSSQDSGG